MKRKITVFTVCLLSAILLLGTIAEAYDLPQKYSSDDYKSPAVEVEIPPEPEKQTDIYVYFNGGKMEMKVAPVYKKGTLYVPCVEFFSKAGLTVNTKGGITVSNENVTAKFKSGKNTATVNGTSVTLSAKVKKIKGVVMCPADLIGEVLNAKVWYDEASMTFAVTNGKYKSDDILRIYNYKFWMNGEPYYEISFNKFDLFGQVASYFSRNGEWPKEEDTYPAAKAAIEQLHSLGFRTIRAFDTNFIRSAYFRSDKQKGIYFEINDMVFDLCDENDIHINCCLALPSEDFCAQGEDYFDLVCNPNSESRKNLYSYIEDYVGRYKSRKSVLMWEIVNEGNLETDIGWAVKSPKPSLYQLGCFYTDVANKIREVDPDRLVTGGDSCFRASQWHQYLGTKEGKVGVDWTRDTLEDRMKAYVMLYSGLDVVSMHCYSTGLNESYYKVSDEDDTEVKEDFNLYMKEVRRLGKVFYNGECAVDADNYSEEVYEKSLGFLQSIIDAGVQLSHWWTFRNNTKTHMREGYGWQISDGELLEAIVNANKQLKETYIINAVSDSDTKAAWSDVNYAPADKIVEVDEASIPSGCGSEIGLPACTVSFIMIAAAAVILHKKKCGKRV